MKKVLYYFLCLPLLLAAIVSCSDDDDIPYTGENGRLSSMQVNSYNTYTYYYYQGNKISHIQYDTTFKTQFLYTGGELTGISTSPTDERIADGNSATRFNRDENTITIESWGEPSFFTYVQEIELDDNDIPVKITDVGFEYAEGDVINDEMQDRRCYSLLSIDPTTRRLLKEEVFLVKTSEKVATYTYEYEDTPGMISKVDLPLWFYIYRNHMSYGDYSYIYFNYAGNLVKKVIDDNLNDIHKTVQYKYEYNKAGFPERVIVNDETYSISY